MNELISTPFLLTKLISSTRLAYIYAKREAGLVEELVVYVLLWHGAMAAERGEAAVMTEAEAKTFVEQLVGFTGDDHERFLLKIKNRFDRYVHANWTRIIN